MFGCIIILFKNVNFFSKNFSIILKTSTDSVLIDNELSKFAS